MTGSNNKLKDNETPEKSIIINKPFLNSSASSSSPILKLDEFTNEKTFFYKDKLTNVSKKNVSTKKHTSQKILINNKKVTFNVKMSFVSTSTIITQKTILSTLRHIETQTYPRTFYSPPKHHEISDSEEFDGTLGSYNSEQLYKNYNPEIGLRIALSLGSLILILIFYLIWHNSCSPSRNLNLDMEFWLGYIDRKKIQKQKRADHDLNEFDSLESLYLPEKIDSADAATANWVLEHSYLTQNLPKISNKYFLNELNERHKDNYINKELLLFKEKIKFETSFEEIPNNKIDNNTNNTNFNDIKNSSFNTNKKRLSHWYLNTFKHPNNRRNRKKNRTSYTDLFKKLEPLQGTSKRRNAYHRRSWPVCNNDYLDLNNMRNRYLKTLKNNQKRTRETLTKSHSSELFKGSMLISQI